MDNFKLTYNKQFEKMILIWDDNKCWEENVVNNLIFSYFIITILLNNKNRLL